MPKNGFRYLLFVCFICLWGYLQAEYVVETRDVPCVELSDQMLKLDAFVRPYNLRPEERLPWNLKVSTRYLLQQIQQFRQ